MNARGLFLCTDQFRKNMPRGGQLDFQFAPFFSVIKIPVSGNLYLQRREPLEEEGKQGEITGRRIYGRNFRKI